jgi:hypothetical protein
MNRIVLSLSALALAGAVSASVVASAATEKSTSAPHASALNAGADASAGQLSGKVVETMDAGGYTYVCLEKKGKKTWVAAPQMKVTVGQEMTFAPGGEMKNFTSKTLNKTFDSIIFTSGPVASGKSGMPAGHGEASMSSSQPSSPAEKIQVSKAEGADAYTVAEIYAKRKTLNKKTAVVHAKVVKVSAGIMGMNWIHLQDGTGDSKKGSHNLVATCKDDKPAVGDVVTIKGTVTKDKDFGAGYKYSVILEKAALVK